MQAVEATIDAAEVASLTTQVAALSTAVDGQRTQYAQCGDIWLVRHPGCDRCGH